MCGRTYLVHPRAALRAYFRLADGGALASFEPRYSYLPGELLPVVVVADGERRLDALHWGIELPPRDPGRPAARPINLRSDRVLRRGRFRRALESRRCILPVSGFFEPEGPTGRGRRPQWVFRGSEGAPLGLAGVWQPSGTPGEPHSFALFTTEPNAVIRPVHDRMPVVLDPHGYTEWLDPGQTDAEGMAAWLRPCPESWLEGERVVDWTYRCDPRDPECIAPHREHAQRELF